MDRNILSPYVRVGMYSVLAPHFTISEREIFDYELIYVGGGECEISFEGVPYTCKKGDAVLIPPGVPHKFTVGGKEFLQPHVHFDPIYGAKSSVTPVSFKSRKEMSEDEVGLISEHVFADVGIPYVFTPDRPDEFARVFFEAVDAFLGKKSGYELICKARMTEICAMILAQFDADAPAPSEAKTVAAVKSYIDANYKRIITLEMLEKQFYINKFTLMRNFKRAYRVNIMSYYRARRLEYAKKSLLKTALPVGAISEKLNFTDIYSFSRFFKMQTGKSPRDFREGK